MNKRQYKKMKKTKVEKEFIKYIRENADIHVSDKEKTFYIFKVKENRIDLNQYNAFLHVIKYLRSKGMQFVVVPDDINIEVFEQKETYIKSLINTRDMLNHIIYENTKPKWEISLDMN